IKSGKERMPLGFALPIANDIISSLKKLPQTKRIIIAGSVRRMKETVKDIDILVTSIDPETVMAEFIKLPQIMDVLAHGSTKSSVLTKDGIQVDLRVVEPESFGAALVYFTGSQAHNIRLREMAVKKGWKINEYGVFNERTNSKIAGKEEEEIYKILGLPFIPPELREDTGEVEAAIKNRLPILIELKDIKGDLHVHSKWSDGSDSLEVLAEAAQRRGYEYIVITDHSKSLPVAGGLKEEELIKQVKEIEKLNKTLKGFRLLTGAEVDILSDGKLAFSDDILSMLDFAVAAVHSGFKQTKEVLTKRLIKAMQNKFVRCIVHPTGRLMGVREGYEIDFEEIYKVARDTNTAIEINAYPERMDLTDINCHRAKEVGVKLAISTDAHTKDQLDNILFGISVARRGWIEKDDVLNTLSLDNLLEGIKK
ncbi:MAG: DNA polymerase/3'-5' exonuclease PolX, partial [Candidatus Omnitrophica bacterium]|nr:DNA polymerase/3'-5' exonuclease PolX [Candidatus Omnitrophota bacterium]